MGQEQEIIESLILFQDRMNSYLDENIAIYGEEIVLSAESLGYLFSTTEHYFHLKFTQKSENTVKLVKVIFLGLFDRFKFKGNDKAGEAIFNLTKNNITNEKNNHYKIGYSYGANIPMVVIANYENLNIWGRYIESLLSK